MWPAHGGSTPEITKSMPKCEPWLSWTKKKYNLVSSCKKKLKVFFQQKSCFKRFFLTKFPKNKIDVVDMKIVNFQQIDSYYFGTYIYNP